MDEPSTSVMSHLNDDNYLHRGDPDYNKSREMQRAVHDIQARKPQMLPQDLLLTKVLSDRQPDAPAISNSIGDDKIAKLLIDMDNSAATR